MLRMMARGQQDGRPIVVVESPSDVKSLRPLVDAGVKVQSVGRKSLVIGAQSALSGEVEPRFVFIVDCDNEENAVVKGAPDMVLTTHRDLECDLLFSLDGARRVAHEMLSTNLSPSEVDRERKRIVDRSVGLTCRFSAVKDAGRARQLHLRLRDPLTGVKRRLGIGDLPELAIWARGECELGFDELLTSVAATLDWTTSEATRVSRDLRPPWKAPCVAHEMLACWICRRRRLCNGHDLEACLAAVFTAAGAQVSCGEIERLVRVGADASLVEHWPLVQRLRQIERRTGVTILRAA